MVESARPAAVDIFGDGKEKIDRCTIDCSGATFRSKSLLGMGSSAKSATFQDWVGGLSLEDPGRSTAGKWGSARPAATMWYAGGSRGLDHVLQGAARLGDYFPSGVDFGLVKGGGSISLTVFGGGLGNSIFGSTNTGTSAFGVGTTIGGVGLFVGSGFWNAG